MYQQISQCRICKNTQLTEVLDLGIQALTHVFPKSKPQKVAAAPLKLVKCTGDRDVCGLLQLQHTYDLGELYDDKYGYRSGLNASMVAHLRGEVRRILDRVVLRDNALIIDVGASDSTTLQAYPAQGCTLVGIDPKGTKFVTPYPQHIQLIPKPFSAATVQRHFGIRRATVITSFSMFSDVEEPLRFMREICEVLDDDGVWILEQGYMPTMLRTTSYDTVCHQHLEYYALKQLKWMADKVGLRIVDVEFNVINGGSFSVMMAKQGSDHIQSPQVAQILSDEARNALDTLWPYQDFAMRVTESRVALRAFLDEVRQFGEPVSAIGASTKGNVILQYCNVTEADVARVGEVNPDKVGSFTPGTLLPIVSEEEILDMQPDYLLVLPWHFRNFFVEHPKFVGRNLLFPLPELDVVHCAASPSASADAQRCAAEVMRHAHGSL